MAISDSAAIVGVDVAKAELVIGQRDTDKILYERNDRPSILRWLKTLPAGSAIAVEATNIYHLELVELAHDRGHRVFVVDSGCVNKYRQSLGQRAKTDACDARLLARYLEKEGDELRQWNPPPVIYTQLKSLLHRRGKLIKTQVSLRQSWGKELYFQEAFENIMSAVDDLERQIQKKLKELLIESGQMPQVERCQQIEGVGFLTATGLVMAFLRGEFKNSDAYVAFLGLDLTVRDSGTRAGRRRLSKKGDAEVRRLGHNASMAASRSATWAPYYQNKLAQGKAKTEALTALTRKLIRVAFSLMKNESDYQPMKRLGVAPQT